MILLNFSHPLTPAQIAQLEALAGQRVERVVEQLPQFDHTQSFAEQARTLVDGIGLSAMEWQSVQLLIVPPAFSFITGLVLAELHGRMGYFPSMVRLRPAEGGLTTQFEVAEVINLQSVRDAARTKR